MQQLQTVDADTLLYEPLEKPSFVVDGLIPTGLSLFCGSQKIGKSWLMLKLCLCVSQGIPLWDLQTLEGDVLYLCLEDTFCRIQDRLFRLTDEASGRLHFAVASCKLSDGLIVQLEDYLKEYPDSRLIVIDTLQKIRTASKDNAYANDYGDISLLKDFADRHSLSVVVVHHIRKQNDSDVFNKVSGTTGLTGSADATERYSLSHFVMTVDSSPLSPMTSKSSVAVPDHPCLHCMNDTTRKRTGGTSAAASCSCVCRFTSSQLQSWKRSVNS